MGIFSSMVGVRMVSVEAVVTRADGTVEDLGVIAFAHKNAFKMLTWKMGRGLAGARKRMEQVLSTFKRKTS